jgi:transposase
MNKNTITYVGKKIFIGIDVHRRTYAVSCICDGVLVKRCTSPASPEHFIQFVRRSFAGAEICSVYEAGFSGFGLHRYLSRNGIESIVVHAAAVEVSAKKRKTDKRDSRKLAEQLAAGRLRGIRIPTEEEENRRLLTRTREQLMRHRRRVMNQIRLRFHHFSLLELDYRQVLTQTKVKEVLSGAVSEELRTSIEALLSLWQHLDTQIKLLDQRIKEQAAKDPLEEVYRSVPGFGPLTSRILATELGDMSQFAQERALFSFTGLTPGEDSSGETRRLGHISREGSGRLRCVLVEAAWRAITVDPGLAEAFRRIAVRAGAKRAIVAIARKLIGRARAILRKKELYVIERKQAA